jgi:hypothetical protein
MHRKKMNRSQTIEDALIFLDLALTQFIGDEEQ